MTVKHVLERCEVEGNLIWLPQMEIDSLILEDVVKEMERIGGKYLPELSAFIFNSDPTTQVEQLTGTALLVKNAKYSYLDLDVAYRMVGFVQMKKAKVLYVSMGDLNLLHAGVETHGHHKFDIVSDMNTEDFLPLGVKIGENIFEVQSNYDIIIAKSPDNKNADIAQIAKLYDILKDRGVIVTTSTIQWKFGFSRKEVEFREWIKRITIQQEQYDRQKQILVLEKLVQA